MFMMTPSHVQPAMSGLRVKKHWSAHVLQVGQISQFFARFAATVAIKIRFEDKS